MPATDRSPSFEWKIASNAGVFTGEQKADLADRMQSIAQGLSQGRARVAFAFGPGFVCATISPTVDAEMKRRAKAKAVASCTQGFHGLVTRLLTFWHGFDQDQRDELVEKLAQSYLRDELSDATAQMQREFLDLLHQSDALSLIGQDAHPRP